MGPSFSFFPKILERYENQLVPIPLCLKAGYFPTAYFWLLPFAETQGFPIIQIFSCAALLPASCAAARPARHREKKPGHDAPALLRSQLVSFSVVLAVALRILAAVLALVVLLRILRAALGAVVLLILAVVLVVIVFRHF